MQKKTVLASNSSGILPHDVRIQNNFRRFLRISEEKKK